LSHKVFLGNFLEIRAKHPVHPKKLPAATPMHV